MASETYERLVAAMTGQSEDAGIRLTTTFDAAGGPGARVMPPTYSGGTYLTADRLVDADEPVATVLLDSYQSQANRIEEALLDARDSGRIALPLFEMNADVSPWHLRLTSLDMPHRYADAYLRDSTIDGVRFDKTEIGAALRVASPDDAGALYRYDPVSLVLGAWNSHRKGRQPKFARAYKSEVIGIEPEAEHRRGGRLDPINLTGAVDGPGDGDWAFAAASEKKNKGERLSEIGHGNALAREGSPGGFTIKEARRIGFLSFAALARLRFRDAPPDASAAARATLAALALAGDRLAFDRAGVVFRSGCELTVRADELAWEMRGGITERLDLGVDGALALFAEAVATAREAGFAMETSTYAIEPIQGLRDAIDHAFLVADADAG
ncbi:MAG: type I-G CRISPR-associated RAMP protein Csb1/Cas7g [Acidimicrobiales bacterium]